ncbi:sulfotransferase 1C4-like isoform X2 [Ptychodera flava]|uniref:sulfotransferase 1C4-like isoform X2 n=1 Tax=Ptychodera flava TaxID=63121 RepID=UPI003969DB2E
MHNTSPQIMKPLLPEFIIKLRFMNILLSVEKAGLESGIGLKQMEKLPSPRLLKSHLPYHAFPSQAIRKKCKIVYVARNPKDTGVSYFHHCSLGVSSLDYKGSWNDFYQLYVNDKVWYGSWFDHVLTWWQRRDDENILFLKYEDMKKKMKKDENVNISLLVGDKDKHQFIRKGVVGDWMNFFTVAQNKEYEKIYEERMKGSGLDFEW